MRTSAVVFSLQALLCIGCGASGEPTLATVEGKVSHKGKPLDGGKITFHHVMGLPYTADIGSDGSYKAKVAVGQTHVTVEYREPGKEEKGGRPGMLVPGKSLIPEKYSVPSASKLTYEVKPGTNQADFKLE